MTDSSPWEQAPDRAVYPRLNSTREVDVAIVGAGIAGITTAYELVKAGKKVALLEQGRIGEGMTGRTTAFVTHVTDKSLSELQRMFGAERAALVWKSGRSAIDEMERVIATEAIDCDFVRCPAYIYATDEAGLRRLRREQELAETFGFSTRVERSPLGFVTRGYLRVEDQAKFHPVKYATALAERTVALGAHVFENSKVIGYSRTHPLIVKTSDGEVHAKQVVLATHIPLGDPDLLSIRIDAYQTYALEAKIPSGLLPAGLFWDTQKPYHYFRVDPFPNYDRLILGGEDHRTGQSKDTREHFSRLEGFLKDLLPGKDVEIVREWSGEILETIDGLPYIGNTSKDLFVSTGFAGNGMTFGVLSAMITRDLILGKADAVTELYRTKRIKGFWHLLGRVRNFLIGLIKGRIIGDSAVLKDILSDEGAIVTMGGKKVAVYRTASGKIVKLSPVCTHMGCMVQWNAAGKTWDCPCHGSRFKKEGGVLNGPASKPLVKLK